MEVAKPVTYKRQLAQTRSGRPFKAVGRPRLTQELRDVVIRIGSENLLWGYKRIPGELKKLGLYAGANSVKRILNEAGIHLGSRRVFCSAPTYAPDSAWVTQQARNTLIWCADQGIRPGFLIRNADTNFSASFDTVWASEGARVIQFPHRAPDANAFAESFIGTIKRECLDFFVCFSRSQLDYILRTWVRHYNVERPYWGTPPSHWPPERSPTNRNWILMMTSNQQRAALQRQIWQIANDVRGAVDGWDLKQYVLGTLLVSSAKTSRATSKAATRASNTPRWPIV